VSCSFEPALCGACVAQNAQRIAGRELRLRGYWNEQGEVDTKNPSSA